MNTILNPIRWMGILGLATIIGVASISAKEAPQFSALVKAGKLPPVN